MTRTTSTGARLAALAIGGALLAACGSTESPVTPRPVVAAAATSPVLAGAFGAALLRKAEREITARGKRALRRSGAELQYIDVSCVAGDERRFTCETVARMRFADHCGTVESTQRGLALPDGEHHWASSPVSDRANDSELCP